MAEYIPKARFPEELASQVLNTRAQRVNPWESLASVVSSLVGKRDAKIEAKKVKEEELDQEMSIQALKGLASGDLKLKPGEVDYRKLHKHVEPLSVEDREKLKKTKTVNEEARIYSQEELDNIESMTGKKFTLGSTVGSVKSQLAYIGKTDESERKHIEFIANLKNMNDAALLKEQGVLKRAFANADRLTNKVGFDSLKSQVDTIDAEVQSRKLLKSSQPESVAPKVDKIQDAIGRIKSSKKPMTEKEITDTLESKNWSPADIQAVLDGIKKK